MNDKKFKKILKRVNDSELDYEDLDEIKIELENNDKFLKFLENNKSWEYDEHDGLKKLLELKRNESGFFMDKYGRGAGYNGIRTLRPSRAELDLSPLHEIEIEKCKNDFKYFRKYYIIILTRNGYARPEPREYQERLENDLLGDDDLVISYPRQSGKTVTVGTYLCWKGNFNENPVNIGIVANKASGSQEVLSKIKSMYIELPFWIQKGIEVWNKTSIEFGDHTRIMCDVPSSDAFRGFTINYVYVDETAYIPMNDWNDFTDSIFPTMNSLIEKKKIMTSTAKGMNHWYHIVQGAKLGKTNNKLVECSWREVPRFDKKGKKLDPDNYKEMIIRENGKMFFKQTEENEFLGSAETLISAEALKNMVAKEPTFSDSVFNGIKIYEKPQKGHSYIIGVDPSKDGIDKFSLQVIDITSFPFNQVATANLDIDYLMMPEHLDTLGIYYNNAFITIENNEGAGQSIADMMFLQYEYENLYRDRDDGDTKYKKFAGFRTTPKSRPLVLNLMKIFIEEGKLIINDKETIEQFMTFIKSEKISEKYSAEEGYFDDLIMSLAISFAPFKHLKAYDDLDTFLKSVHAEIGETEGVKTEEYYSMIADSIGFSDDAIDEPKSILELTTEINSVDETESFSAIRNLGRGGF